VFSDTAEVTVKRIMCHSEQPAKLAVPGLVLLPLLLLCYGVGNVHCSATHENDLKALLDFKQGITSDPSGALNNWIMSSNFCRWNGITCTGTGRPWRVLVLDLPGKSLSGQISSSLGNLTFLNYLDHSHKVPGSTGSRNGVEGRGSSLYKIMVRRGYTSMER